MKLYAMKIEIYEKIFRASLFILSQLTDIAKDNKIL